MFSRKACYVVWTLSFDKECKERLIKVDMINLLKSFPKDHAGVKRGIEGALWNLDESSRPKPVQQKSAKLGDIGQVMISYSWGQQERMRQLGFHLKKKGYSIWLDVEQMEGSVLDKMAEAVEESSVIVIGLSSSYKDSQACHTEAEYAYRLRKRIIFVVAEEGYVAKGWLGALLGDKLWYNPWAHSGGFEAGAMDVIKVIDKKEGQSASSSPLPTSSSAAVATGNSNSSAEMPHGQDSQLVGLLTQVLSKVDDLSRKMSSLESRLGSVENRLESIEKWIPSTSAHPTDEKAKAKKPKKKMFLFSNE
jgi:flagellin-like hook-associated protein FlgL